MNNKHLPQQDPDFTGVPLPAGEPPEEEMIIQELSFEEEPSEVCPDPLPLFPEENTPQEELPAEELPVPEEIPAAEEFSSPVEPSSEEPPFISGLFPEEDAPFVTGACEPVPELSASEEKETEVPEVPEEDPLPLPLSDTKVYSPEVFAEAITDASALPVVDGPLVPLEPETDPALEILQDPEFAPVQQEQTVSPETEDQEYRDAPQQEAPADDTGKKKKKKKEDQRPTLKGRPKRKKGEGFFGIPNLLVTCVWLALLVVIGVTLGRMLWVCAADVLAFGRPDEKVTVTVYEADTMDDVIEKLHGAGLIRYRSLFKLYADISEAEEDIKPGIYDLNKRYDYHALVNFMSPSSTREVIELTIPEGYTCRQIFQLLEDNRVCTAVDIAAYAADGALSDYWFLEDVSRGSEYCLEGFLFPDTYQFYKNSSPREALQKMLDNFDYRFSEELRSQIDTLNANVTGGGYGVREVVIVASLIEKESAHASESATVASVIYNRLFNWDYPALLNIDAAIVYAQGGDAEQIDTSIDSPYNTYRNTGLTPTPIANPGLSSLKAALNPETSDYYFYVLNPGTGMHQFSTTQAEHDAWIDQFYD